jgi:hypothetical protein
LRQKADSIKRQKRTASGEQGASEQQSLCNFPVTKCPPDGQKFGLCCKNYEETKMGIRSPEQSRGKIIITLKQEESFGYLSLSEKDLFGARMPLSSSTDGFLRAISKNRPKNKRRVSLKFE